MWAPSVHNTQPWWFSADGQEISLHADAGRQLLAADPRGREMMISYGAAVSQRAWLSRISVFLMELSTCVQDSSALPWSSA